MTEDRSSHLTTCWTEEAAPDKRRHPSKTNQRNGLNPPGEEGGTPPPQGGVDDPTPVPDRARLSRYDLL